MHTLFGMYGLMTKEPPKPDINTEFPTHILSRPVKYDEIEQDDLIRKEREKTMERLRRRYAPKEKK